MSRSVVLGLAFALVAFAGCVADDQGNDGGDGGETIQRVLPLPPEGVIDLEGSPLPALDGGAHVAMMTDFVETYAPRLTGTPSDDAAAARLREQFEALGYAVTVYAYNWLENTAPPAGTAPTGKPFKVIVAVRPGTQNPDHWVAWGGHYDTTPAFSIQAAYDNGSGTVMALELARLFANVTTNKTVAAFLFNGEEEGLVASGMFASRFSEETGATLDAYVNFDMVGINWPSDGNPIGAWTTNQYSDALNPTLDYIMHDVVGVPREEDAGFVTSPNTRNSDEASFASAGFPTVRYAGLRTAGAYWAYHKQNDTMETIYAQAGGADAYAHGLETVAACAYWTVMALDKMAPLAES